jgi:hypothetical protein
MAVLLFVLPGFFDGLKESRGKLVAVGAEERGQEHVQEEQQAQAHGNAIAEVSHGRFLSGRAEFPRAGARPAGGTQAASRLGGSTSS